MTSSSSSSKDKCWQIVHDPCPFAKTPAVFGLQRATFQRISVGKQLKVRIILTVGGKQVCVVSDWVCAEVSGEGRSEIPVLQKIMMS